MMDNSNIQFIDPEESLARLLDLRILIHEIQENGINSDYAFENLKKYNTEKASLKPKILEDLRIAERLKNDYNLYKDGFSTLEGWVMDNPELREAVDRFLESILKESQV